jgi:hypothetical protein
MHKLMNREHAQLPMKSGIGERGFDALDKCYWNSEPDETERHIDQISFSKYFYRRSKCACIFPYFVMMENDSLYFRSTLT